MNVRSVLGLSVVGVGLLASSPLSAQDIWGHGRKGKRQHSVARAAGSARSPQSRKPTWRISRSLAS